MEAKNNADLNRTSRQNTRKITLSGILSAFIVILLIAESFAPTGRLGFYTLAAFVLSAVIIENGVVWGWAVYAATCAASFLVVPEKLNVLPYILFFGIYTLLKFHIESFRKPWLEILLKLIAFNLFLWPAWSIAKTFLPEKLTQGTWVILGGVLLQLAFLFYDFLFTALIRYYFQKIAPRIRKA